MADERTWALTGRLLMFALLLGCSFGLGGVYGYSRGQQAVAPSPEPDDVPRPHSHWSPMSQAKARSFGLPDVPRDGMARFASRWAWESDPDGCYRYIRLSSGIPYGEIETTHQPLGDTKPGGKIGEVKP